MESIDTHVTEAILDAVVKCLTGLPTTGNSIKRGRAYVWDAVDLPAISLFGGSDTPDFGISMMNKVYSNLDIILICVAKTFAYADVETTLAMIRYEVCKSIRASINLGLNYVVEITEQTADRPEIGTAEGDLAVAQQQLNYTVQYVRDRNNPRG